MQIIKRDSDRNNMVYSPIRSVFDDLFRFPLMDDPFFTTTSSFRSISADVWEEDGNVFVKMAVPGMKEEDLKIKVDDTLVTISASTKNEKKNEDGKKYFYRTMETSFEQSFNLPCRVNIDGSEAKLQDGIVTIKMPKLEDQQSKEIKFVK